MWGHLGALPQTENLTLGQGFSAKASDETVEVGFVSFSSQILTFESFTQIKGEIGVRWLMPVSLTPRKLKQKGCYEFEANLVYCVRLGFRSFQNEPPNQYKETDKQDGITTARTQVSINRKRRK